MECKAFNYSAGIESNNLKDFCSISSLKCSVAVTKSFPGGLFTLLTVLFIIYFKVVNVPIKLKYDHSPSRTFPFSTFLEW